MNIYDAQQQGEYFSEIIFLGLDPNLCENLAST